MRTFRLITGVNRVAVLLTAVGVFLSASWNFAAEDIPGQVAEIQQKVVKLPSALKAVSSDADVVVLIPDMEALSKKIAMLNEKLNLNQPMMGDLLAMMKMMGNINAGIDDSGSLLISLSEVSRAVTDDKDPTAVILLPVKDYNTFIEQVGGDPAKEVTDVMFNNETGYARKIEGYAVVSESRELVEGYQPSGGKELVAAAGTLGRRCMADSDVMLAINFDRLAPVIRQKLKDTFTEIEQEMTNEMNGKVSPQTVDMVKAAVRMYFDSADRFLEDATVSVAGIDIGEHGTGFTFASQFRPESEMSKIVSSGGNGAAMLNMLAKQPYLFAMGYMNNGIDFKALIDEVKVRLGDAMGEEWKPLFEMINQMNMLTEGTASITNLPTGNIAAMSTGGTTLTVVKTSDGAAYKKQLKAMFESLGEAKLDFGEVPGNNGQPVPFKMSFDTTYTENTMQIDGVDIDQASFKLVLPMQMLQQMGPGMMMANQQISYYIAVKGNDVIVVQGMDMQLISKGLAGLGNGDKLSEDSAISRVRKHLGEDPAFEGYLNLTPLQMFANMFMTLGGLPPIELAENISPIGFAISVKDNGIAGRMFVPMDVAEATKGAYDAFNQGGDMQDPWQEQPQQQPPQPGPQPAPY